MVEAEVADFIDNHANDEDEGKPKKRRGGIGSSEKGGGVNEALNKLRFIN